MADTGKIIAIAKAVAGGAVDPSAIESAVYDWLDDHPEATTTVEDGSITKAKLDEDLQETVDDVNDLKSALHQSQEDINDLNNGLTSVEDAISNAMNLPAGDAVLQCVREKTEEGKNIISIMPYRTNGYTSLNLAHTKENLINTPYETQAETFYGLSIVADDSENKVTISGEKNIQYDTAFIFDSNMSVEAGTYVCCGASDCRYLEVNPSFTGYARLRVLNGSSTYLMYEELNTSPIKQFDIASASNSISVAVFIYGLYKYSGYVYPLFGRGEKLTKALGTTVYGGSFDWTTGELVSMYDSAGNLLETPVVSNIGSVDITYYDGENWFYSDTGHMNILEPVTLKDRFDNLEINLFFETLADLRNGQLKTGETVETLGYYTLNDGGGAVYKIREKLTGESDNGGNIIVIGDLVAEMVYDKNGIVDVRQFGARGNGSADDTASFQLALSVSDHVTVSMGAYVISSTLTIGERKWLDMSPDTTIRPGANVDLFIMKSYSKITGGLIHTYLFNGYNHSCIKLVSDPATDLNNVKIMGVRLIGRTIEGSKGIEIDSNVWQVLYCDFDAYIYGYDFAMYSAGTYSRSCFNVKLTSNYSNCAFYGAVSNSILNLNGEVGEENELSDYTVQLIGGEYNTIIFDMVDVAEEGHIPYGILLTDKANNNVIVGITQLIGKSIIDNGYNNYIPLAQRENQSMTYNTISNHRYNNVLCNVTDRYPTTITLTNCTAEEDLQGLTYSDKLFIDTISDIVPVNSWKFTAVDDTQPSSVQIDIEGINIVPTQLTYEWDKRIGKNYGVGFNKITLYGRVNGDNNFVKIASKEYDRELALTRQIGSDITVYIKSYTEYEDVRIVLEFQKTQSYFGIAFITSLGLFGSYVDQHQAFVRSNGSKMFGNIEFDEGKTVVLKAPNGTAYKLSVANDGTLSTSVVS